MKRYVIFAALVPLLGGFLLLLATTVMSGYWSHPPSLSEAGKLVTVFARTLQYSYLFGLLPALMLGAVDDIILHVKWIGPLVRYVDELRRLGIRILSHQEPWLDSGGPAGELLLAVFAWVARQERQRIGGRQAVQTRAELPGHCKRQSRA